VSSNHFLFTPDTLQPFPPAPEKSKVDLQIESGEYFLTKHAKERAIQQEREEKRKEKQEVKRQDREKEFVPPTEGDCNNKSKKRKRDLETKERRA
jgi:ribosomal RNA assembly protein